MQHFLKIEDLLKELKDGNALTFKAVSPGINFCKLSVKESERIDFSLAEKNIKINPHSEKTPRTMLKSQSEPQILKDESLLVVFARVWLAFVVDCFFLGFTVFTVLSLVFILQKQPLLSAWFQFIRKAADQSLKFNLGILFVVVSLYLITFILLLKKSLGYSVSSKLVK